MTVASGPGWELRCGRIERIERLSVPEPNSGCWLWLGRIGANGYGMMRVGSLRDETRKNMSAHRASYETYIGSCAGQVVMHVCDNRACVNPEHLRLGTQSENVADCWRKGRGTPGRGDASRLPRMRGAQNPSAHLTEQKVSDIRERRRRGESVANLAEAFGVSGTHIRRICSGESWT